jgi:pyridoxine 4-dehydrogenase
MSKTLAKSFTLPGTSIALNRMGYGCMQLAGPGVWGPPKDPEAAVAVLRAAAEAGVNHFDTSDFYGPHTTNRVLRQALHPYKNLTVVTKIGFARGEDKSWFPAKSADDLTRAVHDNLTNLGLEALEVVNLRLGGAHGPDDASVKAPLSVLLELQKKRLVRHIGLSTVTAKQVAEARAMAPIVCVQNLYNLANRTDDALVDDLAKEGIAFVPSAQHPAHPGDVIGRSPEGEPRRQLAHARAGGHRCSRRDQSGNLGVSPISRKSRWAWSTASIVHTM